MVGRLTGLLPLILMGCTFVGAEKVSDLKDQVDADADGVPFAEDCDDFDATRFPVDPAQWPDSDIPYDHIDNDCGGDEDTSQLDRVDVDGDGIPGVLFADYEQEHLDGGFPLNENGEVPWPQNVSKTLVDCVDQRNELTDALGIDPGEIHPLVIDDPAYDGLDQDCGGDNDFDADGDGQMPPTVDGEPTRPLVEAYALANGLVIDFDAPDAFADCNDLEDSVYRGDIPDAPYDGIDTNCDGLNDFDQDGDGYYPTYFGPLFTTFVATYHPDTAPSGGPLTWGPTPNTPAQPGDCLDAPHPVLTTAAPEDVYPGADEVWYDGVDSDCGIDPAGLPILNNNDFDQDADGYIQTEDFASFAAFVGNWSGTPPPEVTCEPPTCLFPSTVPSTLEAPGGDCDDTNGNASPGRIEMLFDGEDADCDALENATPFGFGGMAWGSPVGPRIARTDTHFVLATAGAWVDLGASERTNPALFHLFSPQPGFDEYTQINSPWHNLAQNGVDAIGLGLDLVTRANRFWVGASHRTGGAPPAKRVIIHEYAYDPVTASYQTPPPYLRQTPTWNGADLHADLFLEPTNSLTVTDGVVEPAIWLITCGGGGREAPDYVSDGSASAFQFLAGELPLASTNTETLFTGQVPVGNDAEVCFQTSDAGGVTGTSTICDAAGCTTYDIDLSAPPPSRVVLSPSQPWAGRVLREANRRDRSADPAIQSDDALTRGLLILVNQANGFTFVDLSNGQTVDLLSNEDVVSADAMFRDDVLYIAAVVEDPAGGPNRVVMGWSADPATEMTLSDLPLFDINPEFEHEPQDGCDPTVIGCTSGRNLEPMKISLFVDDDDDPTDDRLAIAVSARSLDVATQPSVTIGTTSTPLPQDAVGWLFMGFGGEPPPVD